ncbi:tRNA lysidine(34) synthetase TilS, partial [bacterium]|nr:tRNA lysidine(34) synthetase TilS [bacterium]
MMTDRIPTALPPRALPELARLLRAAAGPDSDREAEPGVLVALSGGADSTALLRLAVLHRERSGAPVEAAHLDHALRGAEAEADADFCRALCRDLDVPLHLRREDPRPLAAVRGRGLEEAARALRREFLAGVLDARPALAACATGHHRDDQAETVLIRLFRGTGPDGLQGIRPRAGRFIHPLLGCGRDEIEAWLAALGQTWRRDATNDDEAAYPETDELALGWGAAITTVDLDHPTTAAAFLTAFKNRYPAWREGLWATARNDNYDIDVS